MFIWPDTAWEMLPLPSLALQQILLNFFIAIILDNLDLDEETKVQRLKVEWVEWRWGGSVQ